MNNWKGVDYRTFYDRGDAFFDLSTSGPEASQAADLCVGDACIVATRATDGRVAFTWYSYAREESLPREGVMRRVLCGPTVRTATFPQADAARQSAYAAFFDKGGNFKRQAVIRR